METSEPFVCLFLYRSLQPRQGAATEGSRVWSPLLTSCVIVGDAELHWVVACPSLCGVGLRWGRGSLRSAMIVFVAVYLPNFISVSHVCVELKVFKI